MIRFEAFVRESREPSDGNSPGPTNLAMKQLQYEELQLLLTAGPGIPGLVSSPSWMIFRDFVSLLSNGPYRASYGFFWWLVGDTKWTY